MAIIDFDVRKNISSFAYCYAHIRKLNGLVIYMKLKMLKELVKNWQDVILFKAGIKKNIVMRMRSGRAWKVDNAKDYAAFWNSLMYVSSKIQSLNERYGLGMSINKKKRTIKIRKFNQNIEFHFDSMKQAVNTLGLIIENFIDGQYNKLNVKGKYVVDIGANIGDTAIFFALKGAKHIYAFEPYPYSYNLASKNIKANLLEDKITLINEGCGKRGFSVINPKVKKYGEDALQASKNGNKIKINALDEIIERFDIKDAVLKIDCEGCEYQTILNAKLKTLEKFSQMIIEYHYGYKNLIKKLREAGFRTRCTLPGYDLTFDANGKNRSLGLIYCDRTYTRR